MTTASVHTDDAPTQDADPAAAETDAPAAPAALPDDLTTENLHELGEKAAAFAVIAERFAVLSAEHTATFRAAMLARFRHDRSDRVGVYLDDEQTVSYAVVKPKPGPKIIDAQKFLEWVAENHPEHIQVVELVMPAFEKALAKRAVRAGDGVTMVDPESGLVIDGMEWVKLPPKSISPSWAGDGKTRILEALAADAGMGELITSSLLALEGGDV
jgi:hypothetical protein